MSIQTVSKFLPVVADSWDTLRKCDVYRLADTIMGANVDDFGACLDAISSRRPDLSAEVASVREDIGDAPADSDANAPADSAGDSPADSKPDFKGRVNFAASVISSGRTATRKFDGCFENFDGDAVCLALLKRIESRPNTKLARNIWNYLAKESVMPLAVKYRGLKPSELSKRLIDGDAPADDDKRKQSREDYERAITDTIQTALDCNNGDAQSILEASGAFYVAQGWAGGSSAVDVAAKIVASGSVEPTKKKTKNLTLPEKIVAHKRISSYRKLVKRIRLHVFDFEDNGTSDKANRLASKAKRRITTLKQRCLRVS